MPGNSIRLDAIRPETASLFSVLASFPQLSGFVLIGGTAIALLIGHRLSDDLDFAFFGDHLPTGQVDALVAELKAAGIPSRLVTDSSQISRFKNAGFPPPFRPTCCPVSSRMLGTGHFTRTMPSILYSPRPIDAIRTGRIACICRIGISRY
ncbi:nucleotidyl transferase AbiEii/AbiGii toxin family protein [Pseudothauera nasutitermitis]|uniref:nucleotidyl transferase AbiEii/AbiGii toxin family protein n=1 Tax=Pseudothauera nasutitermitis TaxID=2565930 RepID=UPI001454DA0C|nr:nucleotidyl transferase AbiEii/AbiGii toxin family protein [Pseudothauera nasutitermitis]